MIHCSVTDKSYIGCSATVLSRMKDHKAELKRGKHVNVFLQRAWDKYGESSFQFLTLLKTEDIFAEEIKLIAKYGTFGGGYNLTPGGEGIGADSPELCARRVETFKRNYSEETRQRKSVAAKAQFEAMSEEERKTFAKLGSEAAKARLAELTEEELSIRSKELSEYSNRRWEKVSKEERSRQNKANWDGKSVEEKRLS